MMKKLFLLLLLIATSSIFAQQGFNYKAVIYDNNDPVQNQSIDVKFTVFENISLEVYQETQTTTTDSNGIIILSLGEGIVINGDFSTINWNIDTFLKVEIDKGAGFQDMGTSQFNYVPLAKYADKAGNTFSGDFNDLDNVPSGLSDGDNDTQLTETQVDSFVANNGYLTSEVDGDTTNELQTIAKVGNTVTLSNSGGSFTDTDTQLTEAQVDSFVANNGYLTSEVDGDTTNELQSLSVNGTQLTISNGNTVTLPTGSGGDQWGSQTVQSNTTLTGDGTLANPLAIDTNSTDFNGWDKNASDDFDGEFSSLNNIPSGLSDGDDNTQLTETQVDNFVANNGYLTSEVDGSTTNELQTIAKVGNTVTLSNGGGSFTDTDTDTQLTETQVDNFVANNGYLTTEVDGSTTNELQIIAKVGNTVTLSNGGGSFTDADTDTQLTETQVDSFVANNGYLTTEVDGSTTNELQTITKVGNTVTLSNGGGSFTDADTDTQLTETQVDSFVANNGYLTSEADGDATNELQTLSISGNVLSISDGNNVTLPSSSGSDVDFLEVGTGQAPDNILDDIYHTGNISIGHATTPNAKLDIKNTGTSTAANSNTGIKITNNNSSNTDKIGVITLLDAAGTAKVYGVKTNIVDTANGDIYGTHTTIGGFNGDGDHFGNYFFLTGEGSGTHTGSRIILSTNGSPVQTGNDIELYTISNVNTAVQTGVKTHIYGFGTGPKYAIDNLIDGDSEGYIFGMKNVISNTANGKHYGMYNVLSGSGTNSHYGAYTTISGSGSGSQIGYAINNYNSGNGAHYGLDNFIYGGGSGEHIGVKNQLSGSGSGRQIGVRNMINNTNATSQYGVYTTLDANSGNGDRFATRNDLFGGGDGNLYGVRNQLSNSGTGIHTGIYNNLYGSGNGTQYGIKNRMAGAGNGMVYGNYTEVENSGSGIHYGNYIKMNNNGSNTEYALYAEVNDLYSYAGYFKGKVYTTSGVEANYMITNKIRTPEVYNDIGGYGKNLLPYLIGRISGSASSTHIVEYASSAGFSVSRLSMGRFKITTDVSIGASYVYSVNATLLDNQGVVWVSDMTNNSFIINTKSGFGSTDWADYSFTFTVYNP